MIQTINWWAVYRNISVAACGVLGASAGLVYFGFASRDNVKVAVLSSAMSIFPMFFIFIISKIHEQNTEEDDQERPTLREAILSPIRDVYDFINNTPSGYLALSAVFFAFGILMTIQVGSMSWSSKEPFEAMHAIGFSGYGCLFHAIVIPFFSRKAAERR